MTTAFLVEKITGGSYEDFVQENLFDPLEMTDASYFRSPAVARRLALPPRQEPTDATTSDTSVYQDIGGYWPSGALTTSAKELTALVSMLLDRGTFGGHRLLSRESVQRFETPGSTLAARKLGVRRGHGINNWTSSFRGVRYHGHGGRMPGGATGHHGYSAYYAYSPERGTGFVFMGTEGASGEELHNPVMEAVLSHLHPDELSPPTAATAAEVGDVVGCYLLANPDRLDKTLDRLRIGVEEGVVLIEGRWRLERTADANVFRMRGDQRGPRAGRPDDALVAFMTNDDGTLVMQHLDHRWDSFERVPCL